MKSHMWPIAFSLLTFVVACGKKESDSLENIQPPISTRKIDLGTSVTMVDPKLLPTANQETTSKRRQEISLIVRELGSSDKTAILTAFKKLRASVDDVSSENVAKIADGVFYETLSLYALNNNDKALKTEVVQMMDLIAKSEVVVGNEARFFLFHLNEHALSATSEAQNPPFVSATPLMTWWLNTTLRKRLSDGD